MVETLNDIERRLENSAFLHFPESYPLEVRVLCCVAANPGALAASIYARVFRGEGFARSLGLVREKLDSLVSKGLVSKVVDSECSALFRFSVTADGRGVYREILKSIYHI